jgi:hypothetical protein
MLSLFARASTSPASSCAYAMESGNHQEAARAREVVHERHIIGQLDGELRRLSSLSLTSALLHGRIR